MNTVNQWNPNRETEEEYDQRTFDEDMAEDEREVMEEALQLAEELDDLAGHGGDVCASCGNPLRCGEIDDGFCIECLPEEWESSC